MAYVSRLVATTSPRGQALQTRIDAVLGRAPLRFGPDSTKLTPTGSRSLEQVAGLLRDDPAARVQVVGHTAMEIVDLPLCQRLSELRADLVASQLMSLGIGPERLPVVGVSHSHPAATPTASRRVELIVTR